MYTQFYGLREKPFSLSPDPRYLYLSDSHREAFAHLLYGIEQGEGFIAITGEVGTGKTTLCRTLLERLEPGTEVAFIFNPHLTGQELLQSVAAEFGLETGDDSPRRITERLNRFLLAKRREGRRVLLIVDEAQTLERDALEQVRLLSNLETSTSKLLQIILIGQPELDTMLESPDLRQLRQRISVRWQLHPLGANETRAYVRHRLRIAGGGKRDIFSELALREIHRHSRGIPRVVNLICDRALLAGYASGASEIGLGLVSQVERELAGGPRRAAVRAVRRSLWPAIALAGGVVCLALAASLVVLRFGLPVPPEAASPAATDPAGAPAPAAEVVPIPPVASAPPPEPSLPRELGPALAVSPPSETGAIALDAMLARWDLPPIGAEGLTLTQVEAILAAEGFRTEHLEDATLHELATFDRPALLLLGAPEEVLRPVLLDRIEEGGAWLHGLGLVPRRYPLSELQAVWHGSALVPWQEPVAMPDLLEPGMEGQAVQWLQRTLANLGYFDGDANGRYGPATAQAVRSFQRSAALEEDGTVGAITQLRLQEQLTAGQVPRLLPAHGPTS
jgi:general secretion pathway protein A